MDTPNPDTWAKRLFWLILWVVVTLVLVYALLWTIGNPSHIEP